MSGGEAALWDDEKIPFVFTDKARDFIKSSVDDPFFLFYSFHDIHVPRMPNEKFIGMTEMGPRGDAISQVDWVVGEIVDTVRALGIEENTIILFTSDNGPVLDDGYADHAVLSLGSHRPAGPYRGGKYSAFEAGTRMPTILRWPGSVAPGVSDALLSQVDLYASLASLLDIELVAGEAIDSINTLSAYLGTSYHARDFIIEESVATLSIRAGNWKYIVPTEKARNIRAQWVEKDKGIEGGFTPNSQLYDLTSDKGEQKNVAELYPEKVTEMQKKITEIRNSGFRNSSPIELY